MYSFGTTLGQYIGTPLQNALGSRLGDIPSRFQSLSPDNQYGVLTSFVTSTLASAGFMGAATRCNTWKGRAACLGMAACSASIAVMDFLMVKSLAIVSSTPTECECPDQCFGNPRNTTGL